MIPPPPEPPVKQLMRHNTAPELKRELSNFNLSEKGTKSDMCLRLVKHNSGLLNVEEVMGEFTVFELKSRLQKNKISYEHNDTKMELAKKYMELI